MDHGSTLTPTPNLPLPAQGGRMSRAGPTTQDGSHPSPDPAHSPLRGTRDPEHALGPSRTQAGFGHTPASGPTLGGTARPVSPTAPARRRARLSARLWLSFGPPMTAKQRPPRGTCHNSGGVSVPARLQSGGRSESLRPRRHWGPRGALEMRVRSPSAEPARGGARGCPTPEAARGTCVCTEAGVPGQRGGGGTLCPPSSQLSGHCWAGPAAQGGAGGPGAQSQRNKSPAGGRSPGRSAHSPLRPTPPGLQRP